MQCYAVNSQLAWKIPRKKPNFETTFNLCIKLRKKERERERLLKKRKWKSLLELEKRGDCYLTCISCYFIYLFLLHVFVSSFYSEHNCHELTSLGTFAYVVGVLCEPVHSIWLALLCLNYATEKSKFRWNIDDHQAYFWAFLLSLLTRLPRIWLIAADSLSVHSATIFGLISFMYSMKAFRGFLICVRFLSSLSRSRAALRLATEVVVVITDDGEMSTEHVLSECGEKLPEVDPGERRPPGPHLDKGLKNG